MGGLGLASFLNHNEGTSRKFLKDWKKNGEIVIWLYTRADIAWASWNHPFITYGTFTNDKDEEVNCLKYPRFVSPDPELVHQNQYFRNDDDSLQVPPALDPFLRLREWLRLECDLPHDTVVFRWVNPMPKPGKNPVVEWRKGHLARLVDRGQSNFGASLDTKLDYLFCVVDDSKPAEGVQIVRGTKLLGEKMKAEIGEQMDSNGETGNPLIHPYAIKWVYESGVRNPMDTYRAFRYNQAELTPQIKEAITAKDFPDPSQDCVPKVGDKARIRAAMEAAVQIDIPWDDIFIPEWNDGESEGFAHGASKPHENPPQTSERSQRVNPPSYSSESSQGASRATEAVPQMRRRKKAAPVPTPPPVEMVPCDDCQTMIRIDQAKCPKCGAEYEIDSAVDSPVETLVSKEETSSSSSGEECWSCKAPVVDGRCVQCGLEASDDLPF